MTLKVVLTNEFKKDYKLMLKRHKDISKLDKIIEKLANEKPLLPKHKNHDLVDRFTSFRECHIEPDWLLIYKVDGFFLYQQRLISPSFRAGI